MIRTPNPYIVGTPIPGSDAFYGREEILAFVEDTLHLPQQRVVVLYGQRRVGKTSVLYEIVRRLGEHYRAVYFDLMGQANRPLTIALYNIAGKIADDLLLDEPEPFQNPHDFYLFLEKLCHHTPPDKPLLLLLDEFDDLGDDETQADAAAHTLFDYLRNLLNQPLPVAFVFVVGRRLTELPQNFQSILKQAPSRRVSFLNKAGTIELITQPAAGLLTYTAEALDTIYHLTSGHPYFTQLICFELFRFALNQQKKEVTAEDVFAVLDNAMETGKGGLAWFWDGLPLAERFVLSAIAEVSGEKGTASTEEVRQLLKSYDLRFLGMEVTDAPHILVSWQILQESNREYQFTVELVRRWIRAEHPLANAKRDVENIVPRANRYFANGREAHQAGYLDDAIDDYRRAVTANPFHMRAQLGLAQALHERLLNLLSENNYQVGSHLNQDLDEAQQAFTKAYELDSAATKDSYLDFLDNLATYLYSNNYHQQAMLLAEKAQKLEFSQERADRIGRMAGALEIHRQSYFSWRMARWGAYGSVLVGLLAVIVWLVWPSLWPTSTSAGVVITPAAPQEMVVLIADFEGSAEVSLSPAANLEAEWQSTFTHIRFERTNSIVQNEARALELAVPLGAVGVLWGDVTTNQVNSHFTFVNLTTPPEAFTLPLTATGFNPAAGSLTNDDLVTYAKTLTTQFSNWSGPDMLTQLATVPPPIEQLYTQLAQSQLLQADTVEEVALADTWLQKSIQLGFFAPLIFEQAQGVVAYVPAGEFTMGRDQSTMFDLCDDYASQEVCDVKAMASSHPPHQVYLQPFFIDQTEVTNKQYQLCQTAQVCSPEHTPGDKTYPAVRVNWFEAQAYCQWRGGRLPTEAEWEKAARWNPLGYTETYPWGNATPTEQYGNIGEDGKDTLGLVPVGQYPAGRSPTGVLDMVGNALEWTADYYDENYYAQFAQQPTVPQNPLNSTPATFVSVRSTFGKLEHPGLNLADPAARAGWPPAVESDFVGWRCVYDSLPITP